MQDHNQNKLRISVFIGIFMILGLMACYGLDPSDPSDANGDMDNDGYTNLQEYQHGWNPMDPNSPPKDTDKDGMPDTWETQYGLDPNDPSDASGDLDNDGYTNLKEYQKGWNPTDPNSTPIPQDWSAPQTVDGRTARVTTSSGAMFVISLSEDDGAQIRFKEVKIGIHYKIDGEGIFPVLQYCGEEYFKGPGYGTNQPATGWTEAGFLNGTSGSWRTDVITLAADQYDYWPKNPGIQILMNFPYPITVARMWIIQEGENAVFFDVGGPADTANTDSKPQIKADLGTGNHTPGFIMAWSGFSASSVVDGYTCRVGNMGGAFFANLPDGEDALFSYSGRIKVGMLYKTTEPGSVSQFIGWDNGGWLEIGQLVGDEQWHTQVVELDRRLYDYVTTHGSGKNILLAVGNGEVTLAGLWLINETPKADVYFDVGGPADTGSTAYELFSRADRNPGFTIAVPPIFMEQWYAPSTVDGYTARTSLPSTEYLGAGGFLVNLPGGEQAFDYRKVKIGIMYKTSAEGTIAQFLGATNGGNVAIGRLIADGQWHTQVVEFDSRFWDYKKQSGAPGQNINVGFLPDVIGGQVTLAGLWLINETPKANAYFDVGGPEDTVNTANKDEVKAALGTGNYTPGFMMYWRRFEEHGVVDGYTCRVAPTWGCLFVNLPDGEDALFSYSGRVKIGMLYKAAENNNLDQRLSANNEWAHVGQLVGDNQWHMQVVELDPRLYDYVDYPGSGRNILLCVGSGQVTLAGLWLVQEETVLANLKVSGTDIDGNRRVARSPVFLLQTDQPYLFTCKASARWVEGLALNGKLYTCNGLDGSGPITHVMDITLPIRNMAQYDFAVDRFGIASYQNEDMVVDIGRMTIGLDCIKLGNSVDASLWQ